MILESLVPHKPCLSINILTNVCFQLFDYDKDGILNLSETQRVLRCLGLRTTDDQTRALVLLVSVDKSGGSVSFNEYLRLVSMQRRAEPDEQSLTDVFQ